MAASTKPNVELVLSVEDLATKALDLMKTRLAAVKDSVDKVKAKPVDELSKAFSQLGVTSQKSLR